MKKKCLLKMCPPYWRTIVLLFLVFSLFIGSFVFFTKYLINEYDVKELRETLRFFSQISAKTIDTDVYKKLVNKVKSKELTIEEKEEITKTNDFVTIQKQLEYIRSTKPELIGSVYLMIPTNDQKKSQFVVDRETTPENILEDKKRSDWQTYTVYPGNYYDISDQPTTIEALQTRKNIVDTEIRYDPTWDKYSLMGFAPVFDTKTNEYLGILGIDLYNVDIDKNNASIYLTINMAMIVLLCVGLLFIIFFAKNLSYTEELKETKSMLEQAYDKLQGLDEKKTEFLNVVSHELRTPITSIKGYASMLIDGDLGILPPTATESVQVIFNQANRLGRLINNMLDISKIEAGKSDEFVYINLSISGFLQEIRDEFISLAREKSIELIWQIDIPKKIQASIPADRLKQAIVNIIANAIKFTPRGGKVTLSATYIKKDLCIKISDTGEGIEKKNFGLIFEKFGQVQASFHKKREGTGLGLPITKAIIQKMNGGISLESHLGVGTTFTINIPIESKR